MSNLYKKFVKNAVTIIILFISLIYITYYHPISENMHCDSNYQCSVVHNYFNLYRNIDIFQLSSDSKISNFRKVSFFDKYAYGNMYLKYDEQIPFIYYFKHAGYYKYYNYLFSEEKKRFEQYLKNPSLEYNVNSAAKDYSVVSFLLWSIFSIVAIKKFIEL